MFSHIVIGTDDIAAARTFYDAVLGALGVSPAVVDAKGRLVYAHADGRLIVTKPVDGGRATAANGSTIGFAAASREAAAAWHAAGLAHGGTACENPPGVRDTPVGELYLAYLRDPTGNKLCALHRVAG